MSINKKLLRVELAKREMTLLALAKKLKERPSTLSAWLRDVNPHPVDLAERIEGVLELQPGTLANKSNE